MSSVNERLCDIKELFELINTIPNMKTKTVLLHKFNEECDFLVDTIERLYYDTVIRNKKWIVSRLNKERHDSIINTRNTLNTFMPYMIAYNVLQNVDYEDYNNTNNTDNEDTIDNMNNIQNNIMNTSIMVPL